MLTHDELPCHCLPQTWSSPGQSSQVLIWYSGELLFMALQDSLQSITVILVGIMMAIRWLEAHVRAGSSEHLEELDCLTDFDLLRK